MNDAAADESPLDRVLVMELVRVTEAAATANVQLAARDLATQVRRLMGALTRRGYDVGVASAVVREARSSG